MFGLIGWFYTCRQPLHTCWLTLQLRIIATDGNTFRRLKVLQFEKKVYLCSRQQVSNVFSKITLYIIAKWQKKK